MPKHLNLKNVFSAAQGRRTRYGMAKALHLCGLDLVGAHHRALDDAKNIARLLPWIVGGERLAGPRNARSRSVRRHRRGDLQTPENKIEMRPPRT